VGRHGAGPDAAPGYKGRARLPELFRALWVDLKKKRLDRHGGRRARRRPQGHRREQLHRRRKVPREAKAIDAFFDKYVRGTDELPLPALWRRAGLAVHEEAEWEGDERRRRARRPLARVGPGITLYADRTSIRNVVPGSPAAARRLTFSDDLVAVDGARVTAATFAKRIGDRRPGDAARVTYFRRDELREATLTLAESPDRKLLIAPDKKAPAHAKAVLRGWLGVT